jgi:hypothetical protein
LIATACGEREPADAVPAPDAPLDPAYTSAFDVADGELTDSGRNPWFVLEPGYTLVLEHGDERLVITVLAETLRVAGVVTRVVEERETKGGTPVEVSRNYFAISRRSNTVYYFGEDVDTYERGQVTGHEGSWRAGEAGARFGMMMPGDALAGARYYQEVAPGIALDRAEVVSVDDSVSVPLGTFRPALRILETTPLERAEREYKMYGRDVGLLVDGDLRLVSAGGRKRR